MGNGASVARQSGAVRPHDKDNSTVTIPLSSLTGKLKIYQVLQMNVL